MPESEGTAATAGTEQGTEGTQQGAEGTQQQQTGADEQQLGDAGRRALEAERTARREAEQKLRDKEKEIERARLTEKDRLEAEKADITKERDLALLEARRLRVGAASGLPSHLWDRLQGSTEKEMKDDAEALAKALGSSGGGLDGGARGTGTRSDADMNTILRRAAGRRV